MTDQDAKKLRQRNRRKKRLPFDSQSERKQQRLFDQAFALPPIEPPRGSVLLVASPFLPPPSIDDQDQAEKDIADLLAEQSCRYKDCARLALPGKGFCREHHNEISDVVKGIS